ncbi:unnamed protein product [Pneumocystis jirovecii]|uniref:WH2 domain-containing protein n=1 Tax=Pneumocystis jirovecii TaxID=42068 RepID=L0PG47_PNEJI|nr:unnamed protein product [Pneumocystis jirovecii]
MSTKGLKLVPPPLPPNKNTEAVSGTHDIRKALKKTVTNDRSAPMIRKACSHEVSSKVVSTALGLNSSASNDSKQLSSAQKLSGLFADGIPKLKHREGGIDTGAVTSGNTGSSQKARISPMKKSSDTQIPHFSKTYSSGTSISKNNISFRSVSDLPETSYMKANSSVFTRSNHLPPPVPGTSSLPARKSNTSTPSVPPPPPPPTRNVSLPTSVLMTAQLPPPPPPPITTNKLNSRPPPPPPPPPSASVNVTRNPSFHSTLSTSIPQKPVSKPQRPYVFSDSTLYTGPGIKPSNVNILSKMTYL